MGKDTLISLFHVTLKTTTRHAMRMINEMRLHIYLICKVKYEFWGWGGVS